MVLIDTTVVDGVVTHIEKGKLGSYGSSGFLPKIYVQTPTKTTIVEIPFSHENKWNIGDSITIYIQNYKEICKD
jgi:hypothetical protein